MKSTGEPGETSRRKRGSRRTKEAWRKNVDIGDVEQFLEEQRLDERLGRLAEKPNTELYVVDTQGDGGLEEVTHTENSVRLSNKQRKRAALSELPKCYQALLNTSQVPDPNKKRNTVRPPGTRSTALSRVSSARKLLRGTVDRRRTEAAAAKEKAKALKSKRRKARQDFSIDVWSDVLEAKQVESTLQTEWLPAEAVQHNVLPERRTPRPAPAPPLRSTPRAIEPPHPGQSYNPSYQEYQELLATVCEKEKLLIKKERHLQRVTAAMFKRVAADKAQTQWLTEMMAGLPERPTLTPQAPADESASDTEYSAVNPPVKNKKKDAKARRKQKEQKQQLEEQKKKKIDKKKIADLYKLRFLESAIEAADARLGRLRAVRLERRSERRASGPPTLNAHKHRKTDEEFLQPHELAPALRAHTQTGNLLKERFESMQRRGVLAPSRIFLRKKLRLKRYFKPGHKVTPQDVNKFLSKSNTRSSKTVPKLR